MAALEVEVDPVVAVGAALIKSKCQFVNEIRSKSVREAFLTASFELKTYPNKPPDAEVVVAPSFSPSLDLVVATMQKFNDTRMR